MDVNAHLNVEMVLNEGENEEEKRFNEIICYDSGDSDEELSPKENEQRDTTGPVNNEMALQNSTDEIAKVEKRSNAAQMRKYRARQRSDPIRYQQYLQRERVRNYKRKHEKRIRAAQQRAQALGIPYIVLDTPHRRGRKTKFNDGGMFMVLPAKYEDDTDDETYSFDSDDMPMIPCKVELHESDEIYQEQKPDISVVNINKLMNYPRSALQTLLPQEVNDRQRVSNFIKLEHDYVKQKMTDSGKQFSLHDNSKVRKRSRKSNPENDKNEFMKLQQQCSFILNKAISCNAPKRRRGSNKMPAIKASSEYAPSNCVEHEDLDDLFKELAEVATKEQPKMKHPSPNKKSPGTHSPRKQCFFNQMQAKDDGQFSLTVSMPVQPIVLSELKNIKCEPTSPAEECVESTMSSIPNEYLEASKKVSVNNTCDVNICNEDSIEIKQEPTSDDDCF